MRLLAALAFIALTTGVSMAQDHTGEGESIPPSLTPLPIGEWWYGMYTASGETEGYARIQVSETKQGGRHVDWELHITYEGGSYEEARKITFTKDFNTSYTEISTGASRILAAREGKYMVGKSGVDDLRVEVAEDAVSGMGFMLAACLALKEGTTLVRPEFNEAADLKAQGEMQLTVGKRETLKLPEGEVEAWKIEQKRGNGTTLPVWVNDKREIVQTDWGNGSLMKLHRQSTKHLFQPKPPTLDQLEPDDKTKLLLTGVFAGFTLDEMWKLWTTPEGMAKWWAPASEMGAKVGEIYELRWPNPEKEGEFRWVLEGKLTHFDANKKLGFTWRWKHETDGPTLNVEVEFEAVKGGVKLTIHHGKFDPLNDDQQNRASLHQGWEFFCTKLKALRK